MDKGDVCAWSSSETRCLLCIWAEDSVQRKLEDSYRNRAVYESIARRMNESGYSRTWQQCQRKIKHLKLLYRKAKSSNCDTVDRASFPFYDHLDQVLRGRRPSCPGEGGVMDSADSELSFCAEKAEASESPVTENTDGESDDSGGDGETARTEAGISPDAFSKGKSTSPACGWSSSETRCLLCIWAEDSVQRKLEDSYRNRAVYESIARRMNESGYSRTWQQCQRKIKHLKLLYRKAKSSNCDTVDRASFPFYDHLDQVLRGRRPSCPGEGGVMDSADSELSFCAEKAEASESPVTENTDGESDDSGGDGDTPRTKAEISSGACSKRKSAPAARGATRRKKSKFDTALELIAKALTDSRDDELLLKMQQAQHAHEEKLFGMMMQSIAMLVSAQHPPGNSASL